MTPGYFYYVMELADDASAERGVGSAEQTLARPAGALSHQMGEERGEGSHLPSSILQTTPLIPCVPIWSAATCQLRGCWKSGWR
jgi:hypothetical protein